MPLSEMIRKRMINDRTLLHMMNESDKAVFCRDFKGIIVYWNKGAERLYRYLTDEVIGKSISIIKPENYPVEMPFIDERIKRGEGIKAFETTRINKNGVMINVSSTIIPLEENGQYIAALHLEENITIKKSESHEKRFRKILESFPDIIFELDQNFNIIWANKAALELEPLAIGQKCYQAYIGLENPCEGCAIVNALEKGETQQSVTHHNEFQNEEKYWENLAIPVKDSYGSITSIIEVSRDITTRKLAERELLRTKERLELSMKAGNVAWWIWDYPSGRVEYDKRKAEMAGYTYEEFPNNVYKITELIHPEDYDKTMQVMSDHLKGNIPEYRIDYRLKTKENDYVWFHDRGKVIERNEDGSPLKLSGAVIDITKRKEVEEKLRTTLEKQKRVDESLKIAKEQAEEANRAKSDFLANMSHEIRTPLNGIVGFTELLQKTNLTKSQRRYMDHVHNSATALLDIINDILDFSKIEAGKRERNFEKTDLNELISNSLDVIKFKVREKNIELKKKIDKKIPPFVLTDPIRLRQILTNLLSNAAKFTESGEISVSVSCLQCVEEESRVHLNFSVKDTGIGISRKNQKRVFQSFSQADYSTTKKYGGTGLGLAITNNLLNLMGSQLHLESELQEGSVFSFELDLKTAEVKDKGITEYPETERAEHSKQDDYLHNVQIEAFQTKPVRILIAEDNEVNMELTEIIIKDVFQTEISKGNLEEFIHIIKAENGKTAVEKYTSESPEIVFLDIQMPFKNGYEVAQEIRKQQSKTLKPYIIALTAAAVKGEREKCLQAGMDEYLTKPVVYENIKGILSYYLDKLHQKAAHFNDLEASKEDKEEATTQDERHLMHFNSQVLKAVFKNDSDMFHHILNIGKNSLIEEREKLIKSFNEKNMSGVKKSAHKIKGMASNLRFELLQQQAELLEITADENASVESIQPLYLKLLEETKLLEKMI